MTPLTVPEVMDDLRAAMAADRWDEVALLAGVLASVEVTPPAPTLVGSALWYAGQGLPVFPLQAGSKVPWPRSRGSKDATTDPDRIRNWWDQLPAANVAIATGHVVDVWDFDGEAAHASWGAQFGGTWAGLTILGTVSTPRSGGLHLYVPTKGEPNKAGLLPGIDYRGRGGYVVAPPSVLDDRDDQHPGTYRFLRPLGLT